MSSKTYVTTEDEIKYYCEIDSFIM